MEKPRDFPSTSLFLVFQRDPLKDNISRIFCISSSIFGPLKIQPPMLETKEKDREFRAIMSLTYQPRDTAKIERPCY